MFELDQIQGFLVRHPYTPFGVYQFFEIIDESKWLGALKTIVPLLRTAATPFDDERRSLYLALSAGGLRRSGIGEAVMETFPPAFLAGMAARSEYLGDTGVSAPETWAPPFGKPALHGVLMLFAKDDANVISLREKTDFFYGPDSGVRLLNEYAFSSEPGPPHDHFGYREGITRTCIDGVDEPAPGETATKIGEFILGYDDELGERTALPKPEWLGMNASFLAFKALHEDVVAFRNFLAEQGDSDQQEYVAAKMLGRWRSGAPLVLAPDADDPALAEDRARRNAFQYAQEDPLGLKCPLGSHIRRLNPRDTNINTSRRRIVRRGVIYGPRLPEGAPDDGAERGLALFAGCVDLNRQFEFLQREWINKGEFIQLGDERDPLAGPNDGKTGFTIPRRPVRRNIANLPRFTRTRGGEYFFLPSIRALSQIAEPALAGTP